MNKRRLKVKFLLTAYITCSIMIRKVLYNVYNMSTNEVNYMTMEG